VGPAALHALFIDEIHQGGDAVRTVNGVKLIEVEPDAPPPPDIPPWAERCELVETPNLSPALRRWVIGGGVAGLAGSVVALAFFSHWGMAPLPLSIAMLWYGLRPGTTAVVTPSPTGRYLGFEVPGDDRGGGAAGRIAALGVGGVMAVAALVQLPSAERGDWVGLGTLAIIGCYFFFLGLTDGDGVPDATARPSTLRFRALADPKRPLPPPATGDTAAAPSSDPAGDPP
jgi:hypothetical protein